MENKIETIQKVVTWLKDYAVNNGRQSLVVGVSGGIDSALVSTLCAKTGITTYCVILPCESKKDQTTRGIDHTKWLENQFTNVKGEYTDLTSTFKAFKHSLSFSIPWSDLAFANTKSRLRMIALYQVATSTGGIVVGTGNKVEDFGVGFFTKYGDGGVDLSPIADFTKTEVRELAKELGIIDEIIKATPTDGLWEDTRSDEQAIGATYEELEWAMNYTEAHPNWEDKMVAYTPEQLKVLKIYTARHAAAQHKLNPIPIFKR
jgi:NAD+ synthase